MFKFKYLMDLTKVISDNIRVLHRNLIGDNWLTSHERLEEWYKYVDNVQDDITEIGIMLGFEESSIREINIDYPSLTQGKKYYEIETLQYVYNFFKDLIKAMEEVKDDIPADVYSHLEEYMFYFRKEADYKIVPVL